MTEQHDQEWFLRMLNENIAPFKTMFDWERQLSCTDGWMQADALKVFDLVDLSARPRPLFVEVGTWKGKSAIAFAKRLREYGGRLMCIDTWLGSPEFWTWGVDMEDRGRALMRNYGYPSVYFVFLRNVFIEGLEHMIHPFPQDSDGALVVLDYYGVKADVVYVDAAHEEDRVMRDLVGYWKIVKPGGVLFGDDYCAEWPGVVRAVDRFCADAGVRDRLRVSGVVWFVTKPE